jgi:hypothetical protein
MHIRRPLAAFLTAVALVGGGALSACSGPNSNTGTPKDTASNTSGNNPGGASQGNLPDNSNRETTTGGASGADNGG